jgi:phosphonate transport system substrate-binding protein
MMQATGFGRRRLLALSGLAAFLTACGSLPPTGSAAGGERPSSLRVGLIPNQAPDTIKAQYEPFRKYLAERLNQPVEFFVATDYAGVVEAMASDRLDVAYFGGVTFVQAEQRAKLYPIVTEVDQATQTTKYHSVIITNAASTIKTTADIKGRKFAFGDINSTSGSLYPRLMLDRAGIGDFTNTALFIYTGGHDATTLAVANGTVDAGGVEERIMERLLQQGRVDRATLRIVERSSPIEGYPWVVRSALETGFVGQITDAFLAIKDEGLLRLMRALRYATVTSKDYDEVRNEAKRLGLLNPSKPSQ